MKKILCFMFISINVLTSFAGTLPLPPSGNNLLPEWQQLMNSAGVKQSVTAMSGTATAVWDEGGFVRLPVNFAGTTHERASWDFQLDCDMRFSKGLELDFYCLNTEPFSGFNIYLRSGRGWYMTSLPVSVSGAWQHIFISKAQTRIEGEVSGWGKIDRIRISGWRMQDQDTICGIANLKLSDAKAVVVVVRADSNAIEDGSGYTQFANTFSTTLDAIGIGSQQVSDLDLTPENLKNAKLVVLPYNSKVPEQCETHIRNFVQAGGKLIACYTLPRITTDLLGLRLKSSLVPATNLAGFERTADGMPGQPLFVAQGSWRSSIVEPVSPEMDTKVVAHWRTTDDKPSSYPALTITPNGAFFGHVWFGGNNTDVELLMRALIGRIVPETWETFAKHALDNTANMGSCKGMAELESLLKKTGVSGVNQVLILKEAAAANQRAARLLQEKQYMESVESSTQANDLAQKLWFMLQKSKPGEHRAFWCHSAFGLNGKSWDEAIRLLHDHGFNAILPNMLWGGVAYYNSEVLPVHESIREKGDQVEACLQACRKYGVGCHVWKVNWNMSSHSPQSFVEQMCAAGRVQKNLYGTVQERWLCPSHPDNQALEVAAMVELAKKYNIHGIHFDYIRFPGQNSCFCDGCRTRFEKQIGKEITGWPKSVTHDQNLKTAWLDFRRDCINQVVEQVYVQAKAVRPDIEISAAVFRNWPVDRDSVGQDWRVWCEKGWLDFVCPMNYFDNNVVFRNTLASQLGWVGKVRLYPGIGLSTSRVSNNGVLVCEQIKIARELGVSGFTVFNFDSNAEAILPQLSLGITATP